MAYNTGNPIGSTDPRDLYDNAQNLDELTNSQSKLSHPDRRGVSRKTWHAIEEQVDQQESEFNTDQARRESEFDAAQADKQQRFNLLLANSGYEYLADYAAGIEITEYNQVLRDPAGELWRAAATTTLPYTTDGTGLPEGGAFVAVGDADIRNDLAAGVGAGKGGLLVRGSVIYVDAIADLQALDTSDLVDGQVASVGGYFAIGDGGGGVFYLKKNIPDQGNDITVFNSNNLSDKWLRSEAESNPINIRWGGVLPGDPDNNATRLTNIIELAQLANEGKVVYVPAGGYGLSSTVHIDPELGSFEIRGDSEARARFVATSPMEAVFKMEAGSSSNLRSRISFLRIHGGDVAEHCLRAPSISHFVIERVRASGSNEAAIFIGNGWCNDIIRCDVSYNNKDGIVLGAMNNNIVNIIGCKIFINGGIGVRVKSGLKVNISDCTLELNEIAGIYAAITAGLSITGCYFEQNSGVGFSFTDPNINVKSDIILNGSVNDDLRHAYPVHNAIIKDCIVSSDKSDYFVFAGATIVATLSNNYSREKSSPQRNPVLLGTGVEGQYFRQVGLTLLNNDTFSKQFELLYEDYASWGFISDMVIEGVSTRNYASQDFPQYGATAVGSANLFLSRDSEKRYGHDVWSLNTPTEDPTYARTFTVDVDKNPEIAGKYMYFSVDIRTDAPPGDSMVALYASGYGRNTGSYITTNEWRTNPMILKMPETGSIEIGVTKRGTTEKAYISRPVLGLLGSGIDILRDSLPLEVTYTMGSAPTAGYWDKGMVVYNSAPEPGENLGWVCVTAGTPGTWKGFGDIEA